MSDQVGGALTPAELAGGQPASVEDEPHLVQRQARPSVKEVSQEQLRRVQTEFEARLLDRLSPYGLQRVLAWGVQVAAGNLPESRSQAVERAELDRPVVFVADVQEAVHRVVGEGLRVLGGRSARTAWASSAWGGRAGQGGGRMRGPGGRSGSMRTVSSELSGSSKEWYGTIRFTMTSSSRPVSRSWKTTVSTTVTARFCGVATFTSIVLRPAPMVARGDNGLPAG